MSFEPMECGCGCGVVRLTRVGDTSPGLELRQRQGACYSLAYRYLEKLPSDGSHLVHGTITNGDVTRDHAWVIESDGWIWEPTNNVWFHGEDAFRESMFGGEPEQTFEPDDARELYQAGKPIGVWETSDPTPLKSGDEAQAPDEA